MGIKEVFEYELAGEKLISTPTHKICTNRGLVNIDALRYDDVVWKNKSSFITVSNGQDIQTVKIGLKGITTVVVKRIIEAKTRDYIDIFGKKKTEKYPISSLFIILMAMPQIIISIILLLFSAMNTLKIIGMRKKNNGQEKILKKQDKNYLNGEKQKKESFFFLKWGKRMQNIFQDIKSKETAICVEKNILAKIREEDFATTIVKRKHCGGRAPVYNLKTKSGLYTANGIEVSNCDALRYTLMSQPVQEKRQNYFIQPKSLSIGNKYGNIIKRDFK